MEDDFLTRLKSISVKDVLSDQRPATSRKGRLLSGKLNQASNITTTRDVRNANGAATQIGSSSSNNLSVSNSTRSSGKIQTISELFSKPPNSEKNLSNGGSSLFERASENRLVLDQNGPSTSKEILNVSSPSRLATATNPNRIGEESSSFYIPDIDEIEEENFIQKVASAPEVETERITSLRELDADLARLSTLSIVRGVDMRKLSRFMLSEKKLLAYSEKEEDLRSFTYEQLYSDLVPLINGKKLISYDFKQLNGQGDADKMFPFFMSQNFDSKTKFGLNKKVLKESQKKELAKKLKDQAMASMEKMGKKPIYGASNSNNLSALHSILIKAREKHEKDEKKQISFK